MPNQTFPPPPAFAAFGLSPAAFFGRALAAIFFPGGGTAVRVRAGRRRLPEPCFRTASR